MTGWKVAFTVNCFREMEDLQQQCVMKLCRAAIDAMNWKQIAYCIENRDGIIYIDDHTSKCFHLLRLSKINFESKIITLDHVKQ